MPMTISFKQDACGQEAAEILLFVPYFEQDAMTPYIVVTDIKSASPRSTERTLAVLSAKEVKEQGSEGMPTIFVLILGEDSAYTLDNYPH
eukprot:4110229-Pyramimonas_sp.AAC.1